MVGLGIRRQMCIIILKISNVVADFEKYAIEAGIREKTYSEIRKVLDQNKIVIWWKPKDSSKNTQRMQIKYIYY